MRTVFVVDDNDTNLTMAEEALEEYYRVIALPSADKMFKALEKHRPDLILLDIEMPQVSGFEALEELKGNPDFSGIPVIFLTSMNDEDNEVRGFELGAVDFVSKPFSKPVLLNRIKHHMHIDDVVRERTRQLVLMQNGIVYTMADLVESRDQSTGGHIDRTSKYMKILIKAMMENEIYAAEMNDWDLDSVISSARLHDVGKISIPDSILNKPGKLTDEEFDKMKTHAEAGERIIDQVIEITGDAEFLYNAKMFAAYHHERWDGTGYPYGMAETAIPLQGRIMAIIDVYDALTTERPYKKAFTHEKACEIIEEGKGSHFDPVVCEFFLKHENEFKEAAVQ